MYTFLKHTENTKDYRLEIIIVWVLNEQVLDLTAEIQTTIISKQNNLLINSDMYFNYFCIQIRKLINYNCTLIFYKIGFSLKF